LLNVVKATTSLGGAVIGGMVLQKELGFARGMTAIFSCSWAGKYSSVFL